MAFAFQSPVVPNGQAPAFAPQSAPVAPALAPQSAPVAPAPSLGGPSQDLMGLATAELFDSSKPRLPYGNYRVRITKVLRPITRKYGQPFIAEYTVESSDNGVPEGTKASYFRKLDADSVAYLAQWLCQILGAQDKEQRDQVQRLLPFIVVSEVTEQPVRVLDLMTGQPTGEVIQPGMIVGHLFNLTLQAGTKASKNGKIYDIEIWTRLE